ncbi:MAG TPA: UDP-N-acetylglucosamine 1-carboxyvinyltransferase [Symbiobacteriaceae bacterium]|nr:UDP-N-acetylglucosamine 1-carboxyvinyltransferase [Symbiobacteriaceae bacterium]
MHLQISGGTRLIGSVTASGSKNAALALMAAAMLPAGETVLRGVPRIADIEVFRSLMASVGVTSTWLDRHTLVISGGDLSEGMPPVELARKMRASYYLMGPLLGRLGRARVGLPGGCNIGARPVDLHLKAFAALGARTGIEAGEAWAEARRLRGAEVTLVGPFGPSVGATINALLAACVTPGVSRIHGAAQEPEVVEVAAFLNRAGARIAGAGTGLIEVEGVSALEAVTYDVPGDRIEAATYLLAGAATGGDVRVEGVAPWALDGLPRLLTQMGCACATEPAGAVRVVAPARLQAVEAVTGPFPALATDIQPVLVAALLRARGGSLVEERVFDARFGYTSELERLGAQIRIVAGQTAVITGVPRLGGAPMSGTDLRATAALVVGALTAEGESQVEGLTFLDRGYEGLEAKLAALGAEIRRVGAPAPAAQKERSGRA